MKLRFQQVYLVLLSLLMTVLVFSESQLININIVNLLITIIRYGILMAFAGVFCIHCIRINRNRAIFIGTMTLLSVIGTLFYDGGILFLMILFATFTSVGVDIKKIFTVTFWSLLISHLLIVLLCKAGILGDTIDIRHIGNYMGSFFAGNYVRHSFGFLVHNQLPLMLLIEYLLYISIKRDKISFKLTLLIQIANYLFFRYFGSRMVFILVIYMGILYCYQKYIANKLRKNRVLKFNFMCSFAFLMCCLFSVVTAVMYSSSKRFWRFMDLLFNNRISMGYEALRLYGISLFGNGTSAGVYTVSVNNTVDNGYLYMWFQRGLVVAVLIVLLWIFYSYKIAKNNPYFRIVFLVFAVENLFNAHFISYKIIPFYCLMLHYAVNKRKGKRDHDNFYSY